MSAGIPHKQRQYENAKDAALLQSVNVGAIVKVISFNPANMTVDVQPLSMHLNNGKYQSQTPIMGVPVASACGGGFVIRPWYQSGDVGVVLYINHDIDNALASGVECEPNTERNHSHEDAVFVGGVVPGNKSLAGLPDNALVMGTEDGSVYIAITKSGIKIKGNIEQNGETTISKELTVKGIAYSPHQHSGVLTGGDESGPPVG